MLGDGGRSVVAVYDFESEKSAHLHFKANDVLTVLEEQEGWVSR